MNFDKAVSLYSGQPLTNQLLMDLLKGYKRPFDKIEDLVTQRKLIQVKRGIFIAGAGTSAKQPEPFLLANHLKGPSYISMESALSYWGLIPEKVYETTSATTGRSGNYDTPVGRFSYVHLPLPWFSFGQKQVTVAERQVALVATPEKAICDKILSTAGLRLRSQTEMRKWLREEMRMDREKLSVLNTKIIRQWTPETKKKDSIETLISTLEKI